jgi:hypothetical protein
MLLQCSNKPLLVHTDDARRTLAERIGGTVSFVDNVPRGTVMTLRILQQQIERGAAAAVTATAATAAAAGAPAECAASSGAASNSAVSSCDEHSNALLPRTYHTVMGATALEDEHLLKSKHILVS